MSHGNADGKYYWSRAEDCRTVAEDYLEADTRRVMLKVAAGYEQMAKTATSLIAILPN